MILKIIMCLSIVSMVLGIIGCVLGIWRMITIRGEHYREYIKKHKRVK